MMPIEEEQTIKISEVDVGNNRLRKKATNIESLATSIDINGLLHPIVLDENNKLIAGFRRLKAYEYLGRTEIPYRRINSKNPIQAEYDENVERADFALEDIAAIYEVVKKSRIGHRPPSSSSSSSDKVGKLPTFPKGPSDIVTSKIVGHSEKDVNKIVEMVQIAEQKPELKHLIEEVDNNKKRLNTAYTEMIRAQDRDIPKPAPPEGKYDVLYVDPPWTYYNDPVRGSPKSHYETMTNEQLMDLVLPAADKAMLFLWVPYPKTMEVGPILDRWGFEYKSEFVWVKDRFGTGWYVRGQHEKLYICVKGEGLGSPAEQDRPPSVVYAERTEHSKKPEIFYSIIERMYPNRTRIELFARGKAREGWKTWGLEAT